MHLASPQHGSRDVHEQPVGKMTDKYDTMDIESDDTCLVLDTAGLHLVVEDLGSGLFGLGLVDILHQDTLILEDVSL